MDHHHNPILHTTYKPVLHNKQTFPLVELFRFSQGQEADYILYHIHQCHLNQKFYALCQVWHELYYLSVDKKRSFR